MDLLGVDLGFILLKINYLILPIRSSWSAVSMVLPSQNPRNKLEEKRVKVQVYLLFIIFIR